MDALVLFSIIIPCNAGTSESMYSTPFNSSLFGISFTLSPHHESMKCGIVAIIYVA